MKKSDRKLSMDRDITRRDFIWDPEWPEGEAPHEIASQPYGNITMANSDAGADAYTHVAIDEAYRAVQELP